MTLNKINVLPWASGDSPIKLRYNNKTEHHGGCVNNMMQHIKKSTENWKGVLIINKHEEKEGDREVRREERRKILYHLLGQSSQVEILACSQPQMCKCA